MIRLAKSFLTLFLTALLYIPCAHGGMVYPNRVIGGAVSARSHHEKIRMESQEVTLRLAKKSYTVEAVFVFYNSGETTEEWVGFSRGNESVEPDKNSDQSIFFENQTPHLPQFIQFYAWVDGKLALFSPEGKLWLARRVIFSGRSKTMIRVVYEADYSYDRRFAGYRIGIGANWKGSIGNAAFTVDGTAIGGAKHFEAKFRSASCSRKLVSHEAVRFETTDYEPDSKDGIFVSLKR